MKNLDQELLSYVETKRGSWSRSTIDTAYFKLRTIASAGLEPQVLIKTLRLKGLSPYSIKTYFILASQFEEATKKTSKIRQWMSANRLVFKNVYKKKERSMSDEQFEALLKKAETNDIYNFLILMGKAGLRKSEAFAVSFRDLKDDRIEVVSGKGGKQRFVPFSREWLKRSNDLLNQTILPKNLPYQKFFDETEFTPHDLRAYYATKVANIQGMSVEDARDLLGHEDIRTTAKYLRANKNRQQTLIMENF